MSTKKPGEGWAYVLLVRLDCGHQGYVPISDVLPNGKVKGRQQCLTCRRIEDEVILQGWAST